MPPFACCSRAQSLAPCSVEGVEHTVRFCKRDPVTDDARQVTFSPPAVDGLASALA